MIAMGTNDEICEQLNIKRNTFHYYSSKCYKRTRAKDNKRRVVIRIDGDDKE